MSDACVQRQSLSGYIARPSRSCCTTSLRARSVLPTRFSGWVWLRVRRLTRPDTHRQHFDWSTNTLFFEEVPNARDETKTAYWLGGQDAIIDAPVSRAACVRDAVPADH